MYDNYVIAYNKYSNITFYARINELINCYLYSTLKYSTFCRFVIISLSTFSISFSIFPSFFVILFSVLSSFSSLFVCHFHPPLYFLVFHLLVLSHSSVIFLFLFYLFCPLFFFFAILHFSSPFSTSLLSLSNPFFHFPYIKKNI